MPWSLVSYEIKSRQCILQSISRWFCFREKSDFFYIKPRPFLPYASRFCDCHLYPRILSLSHWNTRLLTIFYTFSHGFHEFPSVYRVLSALLPYLITARCSVRSHDVGFLRSKIHPCLFKTLSKLQLLCYLSYFIVFESKYY